MLIDETKPWLGCHDCTDCKHCVFFDNDEQAVCGLKLDDELEYFQYEKGAKIDTNIVVELLDKYLYRNDGYICKKWSEEL